MDWSKNDLSKARVGDKLWDYFAQEWVVVESVDPNYVYPIKFTNSDSCLFDGRNTSCAIVPMYFWDEIHFDIPQAPKRKVKKPVEHWVGYHYDGSIFDWAYTEKQAQDLKELGYIVRHYIDEFEVNEE